VLVFASINACDLQSVSRIFGKEALNRIAKIPETQNKVIEAEARIELKQVPDDRLTADLDECFWNGHTMLTEASSPASTQDYCLHRLERGLLATLKFSRVYITSSYIQEGHSRPGKM
jgi:hypothetical protein